jgi:hypothetical protein
MTQPAPRWLHQRNTASRQASSTEQFRLFIHHLCVLDGDCHDCQAHRHPGLRLLVQASAGRRWRRQDCHKVLQYSILAAVVSMLPQAVLNSRQSQGHTASTPCQSELWQRIGRHASAIVYARHSAAGVS